MALEATVTQRRSDGAPGRVRPPRRRKHVTMWIGVVLVAIPLLASALAPWLAKHDPNQVDLAKRLRPPSAEHWFGTDEVGRDIFARVLDGGRRSIGAGVGVVLLAGLTGTVIGALSGWFGGRLDLVVMRAMDVILAFPGLVLAMAMAVALGPGLFSSVLAVAFVRIPIYARLVRSQILSLREREFVDAAVALGAGTPRILFRHLLPNSLAPLIVQATLDVGNAMLLTSTLSFLGLGVRAPAAEWGAMVSSGRVYLLDHWWYATFPGAAILLTAMGFNVIGDGLRDLLDPRGRLRSVLPR
ncbi:MAG: ABC transporter permease subunit [Bacillota bacterium]